MKKNLLASVAFSLSALLTFASGGDESDKQSFTVDTKSSTLEWRGEKVTGYHTGTVNISEGKMDVEDGRITNGNFTIDMTSIENTDIEDAGTKAKLIGHLKSDDFFSVSTHKTANFNLTSFRPMKVDENGNNYMVKGELTIKGITNEISFPANVKIDGEQMVAIADVTFDRTKWKVRYGSGSFFDSLGDNMISEVEVAAFIGSVFKSYISQERKLAPVLSSGLLAVVKLDGFHIRRVSVKRNPGGSIHPNLVAQPYVEQSLQRDFISNKSKIHICRKTVVVVAKLNAVVSSDVVYSRFKGNHVGESHSNHHSKGIGHSGDKGSFDIFSLRSHRFVSCTKKLTGNNWSELDTNCSDVFLRNCDAGDKN